MDSGKIFLHGFLENNKNNINANEIPIQFPKYSDNRIKVIYFDKTYSFMFLSLYLPF